MDEKLKKYLPWIMGAVLLGIVYYLYRNSAQGTGLSYSVIPAQDTSAQVQAAAAAQQASLQAQVSMFHDIAGLMSQKEASNLTIKSNDQAIQLQQEIDATNIRINDANNASQIATVQSNERIIKNTNHNKTVAAVATTVGMIALAFFCYEDTAEQIGKRREYTHGEIGSSHLIPESLSYGGAY